jgi:DNA helicase-2/ATP-dependent DNA helicase PcrA
VDYQLRPSQAAVVGYTGGKMGVSAVPGSGKTFTLSVLAARLVAETVADDQEVLIVTLVNSAVDHFKSRISALVRRRGLLAGYGYRVRTLHGLAHDIVRERPGLVGLAEDFAIIDEREAQAVLDDAVDVWLRAHPKAVERWLDLELNDNQAFRVRATYWPALAREVALAFVKRAKDLQVVPEQLAVRLAELASRPSAPDLALARMGAEIYANYQRALAYRGVVDFDDLIRLALEALRRDPEYLARLQARWPYILEDEAQDSSAIQEEILRALAGPDGNWVRVGDTNQAIYETFTTADPELLRRFVGREQGVASLELPESGRSQPAIIDLANHLIDWVQMGHPREEVRGALARPHIQPTAPGDPQPNPPARPSAARLVDHDYRPARELEVVADSLAHWLREQSKRPEAERETCAVLAPRNERGFELIELLKARGLQHYVVELLRSTSATRQTARAVCDVLRALAEPDSARKLAGAFRVWRRDHQEEQGNRVEALARQITGLARVEDYLWPRLDRDWLSEAAGELPPEDVAWLADFRDRAAAWQRASALPVDQLVLTVAQDLFSEPGELALAHKLAGLLRSTANAHPSYRLPELVEELGIIARNERRFLGFDQADTGFTPPRGKVTVATMHKAKGLEWDRVYLMSVNNYSFPSGLSHDTYFEEKWFVRDRLNLRAEALTQLQSLVGAQDAGPRYVEGEATQQARLDYVAERLRLLYVGITRAKRELVITWNTGRRRGERLQPAAPLIALQTWWSERQKE